MKILRTPNAGGKWIAIQRGLLARGRYVLVPLSDQDLWVNADAVLPVHRHQGYQTARSFVASNGCLTELGEGLEVL